MHAKPCVQTPLGHRKLAWLLLVNLNSYNIFRIEVACARRRQWTIYSRLHCGDYHEVRVALGSELVVKKSKGRAANFNEKRECPYDV